MFWFLRLWLAHLIADFPLQTNLIFKLKKNSFLGVFIHATIFLILALFLSLPYLKYIEAWIYIFLVWIFHIFIDRVKVNISKVSEERDNIWYFLLDQFIHFLSLIFVFFLPISKYPEFWINPYLGKFWLRFYNSDYYILLAIGYILVVFSGTVLTFYVRKIFNGKEEFIKNGIPSREKYLENIFKSFLFVLFWFGIRNFFLYVVFIVITKLILDRYLIKLNLKSSIINTIVDITLLILIGSLLKLLL